MNYFEIDFIFTRYIFPLEEDIILSSKLGISLSNPKTQEEIDQIKEFIKTSMSSEGMHENANPKMRLPLESENKEIITVKNGLKYFKENHKNNNYILKFLNDNSEISEWELFAKMWVVIRCDYEKSSIYLNAEKHELDKLFYPEDDRPVKSNAVSYVNLLSLLSTKGFTESYGEAIVLPDLEFYIIHPEPNSSLNSVIFHFCTGQYREMMKEPSFYDFSWMREIVYKNAQLIEKSIDIKNAQKLLYIGNLLKASTNNKLDSRMRFINYISILELMLTHNPNSNRFNVEDSISKQFKLKTAILVYSKDKSQSLEVIKNNLKDIYNQRSNIAHGNFGEFQKYLTRSSKTESFPMETFYDLEDKLFEYIQVVIESYLDDKTFVDFLKDN